MGGRRPRDRGASAVEFAIVLPVMLLIIGALVDFGRALYTQVVLTNSAREGVRAVVMGAANTGVEQRTRAAAIGLSTSSPTLAVLPPADGLCTSTPGSLATLGVVYQFDWLLLKPAMNLIRAGSALPPTLSASAVMQCGG